MGRRERERGKRGERQLRDLLRSYGFSDAIRGCQYSGKTTQGDTSPDVLCRSLPYHWESKLCEQIKLREWIQQAKEDAKRRPWVVASRQNRSQWWVCTTVEAADDLGLWADTCITKERWSILRWLKDYGSFELQAPGDKDPWGYYVAWGDKFMTAVRKKYGRRGEGCGDSLQPSGDHQGA